LKRAANRLHCLFLDLGSLVRCLVGDQDVE
jgi:hypothetical protein